MDQQTTNAQSSLLRHGKSIGIGFVALVVVGGVIILLRDTDTRPVRKVQEITMVAIQRPPPPPPPPPVVEQPKMIEQPKMVEPEVKPDKPMERPKDLPPKPDSAPPKGPLGLDAKADGPGDSFNLAGNPGGNGLLDGGGGGSRFGWYATLAQNQIKDALAANNKTRKSKLRLEVRLWVDSSGLIERVQLQGTTGDHEIDDAIQNEVLMGLRLQEAPPKDMPQPMNLRLTEQRPT
jgi:protein TonB